MLSGLLHLAAAVAAHVMQMLLGSGSSSNEGTLARVHVCTFHFSAHVGERGWTWFHVAAEEELGAAASEISHAVVR